MDKWSALREWAEGQGVKAWRTHSVKRFVAFDHIIQEMDRLDREEKEKPGAVVVPPGTIVGHQASSKTTGGMNVAIGEKEKP